MAQKGPDIKGREGSNLDNKSSQTDLGNNPFVELTLQQLRLAYELTLLRVDLSTRAAIGLLGFLNE